MDGVKLVLFDFGGVLADEGFRNGLQAIAKLNRLDQRRFFELGHDLIYACGYATGRASEQEYWSALRLLTGIGGDDCDLREIMLGGYVLRGWMMREVRRLRVAGLGVGILSDHTDWLDRLDVRYGFFKNFDYVFNSYYLGLTKSDPQIFDAVAQKVGFDPGQILLIDDSTAHVKRARSRGMRAFQFRSRLEFSNQMHGIIGGCWGGGYQELAEYS